MGGGVDTASGQVVNSTSAMSASAVYSCVRVLSEAIASLPLVLYRRLDGGGKEKATEHPLYRTLNQTPNSWQTRFEWIEQQIIHQCLRGASYNRIMVDGRGNRTLVPMNPDHVNVSQLKNGQIVYEYFSPNGQKIVLLQDEVLRIPFMVLDGVKPLSVIGAQREAIGASLAAGEYGAQFFANDARPSGGYVTWEGGGRFKDTEEEKKFRENWQNYMTGPNRHKTAFLKSGMTFHELGMTNEDAQFLETRKYQRSEIAGMFRVPPHMIGDLERATFSNIDAQNISLVVHTIGPWLARWEPALNRDLLTEAEQDTYFFEFMTEGLLRGDPMARAKYYQTAIMTGWLNRNEVRAKDNLPAEDGLSDFIVPSNMQAAEMLGKEPPTPNTETPPAAPAEGANNEG